MKKNGFALIEVMFGMAFASAALLGFFSFVNHLLYITSKSLNSITIIEDSPIFYSKIFFTKDFGNIEGEIKIEENSFLFNYSLKKIDSSWNKNIKSLYGFVNIKDEKAIQYLINDHFYDDKKKAK